MREHLATFLAHTERAYTASLPRHVIETFEQYLACGDLARGFVRCHGGGCGHDVLVAFSCKHRGLCPSCGARRMAAEAVQVVDRVLPNVPLRRPPRRAGELICRARRRLTAADLTPRATARTSAVAASPTCQASACPW